MAHDRFRRWLESKGWTQEKAALELGCSQSAVSAITIGSRRPGVDLVHKIERLTERWSEGQIRTEEWLAEAPARRRRRVPTPKAA